MRTIMIDSSGQRRVKENYKIIESEVDFLNFFDSSDNLWIKGSFLASWAKTFYKNRGIDVIELSSHYLEIERILKISTKEISPDLIDQIIGIIEDSREINTTLPFILKQITGQVFWEQKPSWDHISSILFEEYPEELKLLVSYQIADWNNSIIDKDLTGLYEYWYSNREYLIKAWLGMIDELPLWRQKIAHKVKNISEYWINIYKEYWKRKIYDSEGKALFDINTDIQYDMKIITEIAFEYLKNRPDIYNKKYYSIISPYLSISQQNQLKAIEKLEDLLPYPENCINFEQALEWCVNYVEHKRHSLLNGSRTEDYYEEEACKFATWFLRQYSTFRNTDKEETPMNIRVQKLVSEYLQQGPVFWVIVDGLGYWEHTYLLQSIMKAYDKIGIISGPNPFFSVAPSITSIAKWSLISGRYFVDAEKEDESPRQIFYKTWENCFYASDQNINELGEQLKQGNKNLYCFDTIKLDSIFHENVNFKHLINMVESHLEGLSKTIVELLYSHPHYQDLFLIISGDHGQLLGYSPVIYQNMGEKFTGRVLFEEPHCIQENVEHLSSYTYGLKKNCWILHSHKNFGAKKENKGKAVGVHGGAFPEEILVACTILKFNPSYKLLELKIEGSGYAKAGGTIEITITNNNDAPVENIKLFIREFLPGLNRFYIDSHIPPLSKKLFSRDITECPSFSESHLQLTGICEYNIFGRGIEKQEITGSFKLEEMYKKSSSLLDEF